jgi:hypothetical protein
MLPILLLSANHNVFFVLVGLILLFSSLKNIFVFFTDNKDSQDMEDEETIEDFEAASGFDMKRMGFGVKIALNLIIILFFIYSSFYLNPFWIKIIIALSILYRIFDINFILKSHKPGEKIQTLNSFNKFLYLASNIFAVFIIAAAAYLKFLKSSL